MNNTEIRKFRKRVSDERVERGAIALYMHEFPKGVDWEYLCYINQELYRKESRTVLEADAEVIEVSNYEEYPNSLDSSITMVQVNYVIMNKEQFHSEYEEITETPALRKRGFLVNNVEIADFDIPFHN